MPTKRLSKFLSTYSSRGFSENEKVGWQEKFIAQIIATSAEVKGVLSKGIPIHPQKKSLNSALGSNFLQIHSVGFIAEIEKIPSSESMISWHRRCLCVFMSFLVIQDHF